MQRRADPHKWLGKDEVKMSETNKPIRKKARFGNKNKKWGNLDGPLEAMHVLRSSVNFTQSVCPTWRTPTTWPSVASEITTTLRNAEHYVVRTPGVTMHTHFLRMTCCAYDKEKMRALKKLTKWKGKKKSHTRYHKSSNNSDSWDNKWVIGCYAQGILLSSIGVD